MKKKEKWMEIYTYDELKSIQLIEKEILKEFIRVCNLLNVEYIIYGGTLLGQVKYGGMIPWDDDIDVALTRDGYSKFVKSANKYLSNEYCLQTPYNEKNSPFSYTKLRKIGTTFIEKYNHKLSIEKGIYIDIYPIDNIPDNDRLRKRQWKRAQFFCKLYFFRQCIHVDFNKDKFIRIVKHFLLYYILRILPQTFYISKIDKVMTKYNNMETHRKACLFSPNYNNIFEKFFPLVKRQFDGIDVFLPNCYEDHLSKRYGNYKEDIANEKKVGHIPYIIDIGNNKGAINNDCNKERNRRN